MKIIRITKQSKRDRYNLFTAEGFVGALSVTVLAESGLREGDEIDAGAFEQYLTRDDYGKVLAKAYGYLSRRPHSVTELRSKLERKLYEPALIAEVIEHLTELGYLDDADFARRWVAQRGSDRGERLLRHELQRKGIDQAMIGQVLQTHHEEHDRGREAEAVARKRLQQMTDLPWEKIYQRLSGLLVRRGYDYATVHGVLERLKAER